MQPHDLDLQSISILDDARRWSDKAEEARVLADEMSHPDTKCMMLALAEGYQSCADRAQAKLAARKALSSNEIAPSPGTTPQLFPDT